MEKKCELCGTLVATVQWPDPNSKKGHWDICKICNAKKKVSGK